MSACLKIGDRLLDGDQVISALVRYKLLETLAGQVLLDEVIPEVPLTRQEVFCALTGLTDTPAPDDFDGFLAQWCESRDVSLSYFNAVIVRELRVEKFKQIQFASQVESEFLRIKSDLDQVEYSRIQLSNLSLAQELYFQLRDDGAEFAQLARQYSIASEQQTEGWVGPVPISTLPSEIAAQFRRKQVGTVYGPIAVANMFWLVRLEQFTAARLTEATRANLINRMYTQWLQSQVQSVISTPGTISVQLDERSVSSAASSN